MPPQTPPPGPAAASDRLDGWKEIANYLKKDVTTGQRWERKNGMPVHRFKGPLDKQAKVWAVTAEIDAWLEKGGGPPKEDLLLDPDKFVSQPVARLLLLLITVGYLVMYATLLLLPEDVRNMTWQLYRETGWAILAFAVAACGAVVRIYLLTALCMRYEDLGRKFTRLFPAIVPLDLLWAFSPLLLITHLGLLPVVFCGALAFLPFAQGRLMTIAYPRKDAAVNASA